MNFYLLSDFEQMNSFILAHPDLKIEDYSLGFETLESFGQEYFDCVKWRLKPTFNEGP